MRRRGAIFEIKWLNFSVEPSANSAGIRWPGQIIVNAAWAAGGKFDMLSGRRENRQD
jgi:hypothetical protein